MATLFKKDWTTKTRGRKVFNMYTDTAQYSVRANNFQTAQRKFQNLRATKGASDGMGSDKKGNG